MFLQKKKADEVFFPIFSKTSESSFWFGLIASQRSYDYFLLLRGLLTMALAV